MTSPTDLRAALHQQFGFDAFKPGQREVIEHLLAGRSSAAVFATGAGKSLCYQLPATLLPGLTLVVSPLIALMKDQIGALSARGIVAHNLDFTLSFDAYKAVMDEVRDGTARLLYVAPERFNNERFRQTLQDVRVSLFAVDEAHCISEWGHNFRPDYLKLAMFARDLGAERILALTATATEPVLDDICRSLNIERGCAVRTPFYRANLTLVTTPVSAVERDAALVARFRDRPRGPAIVYVTLQRTAEEVAETLARAGIDAKPYHAGMAAEARASTQDWFTASDDGVVVATIAFGMGIDKANIRYVYHYNLPKSLENYSQEIGRAGRDGAPSTCEILACVDDLVVLENFVYGDTPTLAAIAGLIAHLFAQGEQFDVALTTLSRAYDVRVLVLRTLLTYLELRGHLVGGTPFYSVYEFKPLMPSAKMLAQFADGERPFIRAVLSRSKKARVWFSIDAAEVAAQLDVDRGRVVRVLDMLAEREMIELRAKGVRHRYRVVRAPEDLDALAAELHAQAIEREGDNIDRLGQVLALIRRDGCQVSALGAHFSEPLDDPCGHCSWCISGTASALPTSHGDPIDEAVWQRALALRDERSQVLGHPRTLAQLLCGIPSPALTKARLSKHALFGAQRRVAFADVMRRAEEQRPRSL
ncbi:ATP-dependent DNA helicase RecQ [Enhygromyxa salina]|uniref:DNA 3'-5' helicase n=1 Tax=Enhygromyxa salina TaxID=215803 RepID=A0A2S9Y7M8_9BACT|nr:RecQ family ATP-dependent DNA helicase [Enhygromyxa salina]PRQ01072.1 ATP-dependent DNA helicase RecQ [Enhygromyxa salina]